MLDAALVKVLNELIAAIKELKIEVQAQRQETNYLRHALENCELCKPSKYYYGIGLAFK